MVIFHDAIGDACNAASCNIPLCMRLQSLTELLQGRDWLQRCSSFASWILMLSKTRKKRLFYSILSQRVHTWLCPVKIDTTPDLVVSADTYRPQLSSADTAPYWATPDNFSALWNHAAIIVIIIWVISDGNIVVQCRTMAIDSQTLWICAIAISTAKSHWLIDLNCIE